MSIVNKFEPKSNRYVEPGPQEQTIYREDRPGEWFKMGIAASQDARLSLAARGLLVYLLSKPLNWKVRMSDLQSSCYIGRDVARRLLAELARVGYILRVRSHIKGRFEWQTKVYSSPDATADLQLTEKQPTDFQSIEKQSPEEQPIIGQAIYNLESYKREKHKKESVNRKESTTDQTVDGVVLTHVCKPGTRWPKPANSKLSKFPIDVIHERMMACVHNGQRSMNCPACVAVARRNDGEADVQIENWLEEQQRFAGAQAFAVNEAGKASGYERPTYNPWSESERI